MIRADTIAAVATPPGSAGVAVIRISGPEAIAIAGRVFLPAAGEWPPPEKLLRYGRMAGADGKTLDHGLAAVFNEPRSYTGEDVVELSCHGGALVSRRLLEMLLENGARLAEPGEFTQRAFFHGKMDLTQAEAVMDLIHAQSDIALKAAAEQLEGRLGGEFERIRADLLSLNAHLEATIDFPEEDIDPDTGRILGERMACILQNIEKLLSSAREGRIIREGARLAIFGAPNAGKSSLLNCLAGFDRAIVSPIPGTTRDTVHESIVIQGIPFRVVDTAGLRETHDPVESEGVSRAEQEIQRADLALHVLDLSAWTGSPPPRHDCELLVLNKADLAPAPEPLPERAVVVSCTTGTGLDALKDRIVAEMQRCIGGWVDPGLSINLRHQQHLANAAQSLATAIDSQQSGEPPELVAVDTRAALSEIGEILGNVDAETLLGEIFGRFCIGK